MQASRKGLRAQDQGDARAMFHNRAATPRDLALKYGTSVRTIYRWINAGMGVAGVNVLKVLRDAVMEHGCPNQVVTDNGRQFRNVIGELGTRYTRLLEVLGVQPIFARPSHPQTKRKLERWFGTVRSGFLLEARLAVERDPAMNLGTFNALFATWLHRYNWESPHRSLPDHCPPAQVYFRKEDRIHRPLQVIVDWNQWVNTHLQRKVTKYNLISFKGESLAVPSGYAGCKVDVVELEAAVEIYHRDNLLVSHPVDPGRFLLGRDTKSRKVAHNGNIQYRGKYLTAGYKLAGQVVEVREASAGTELLVYLDGVLLKKFAL